MAFNYSQDLQDFLELLSPRSKYVMVTSPFNVVPLTVALAKKFVSEKDLNVLYICSGRHHIFPQKLFQRWEIPLRKIYFMDTVLYMRNPVAGEKNPPIKADGEDVVIPKVYRLFRVDQEVDGLHMSDIDLIILDNLTEFLHFNTIEEGKRFVDALNVPATRLMKGVFIILLKTEGYHEVVETLKESDFVEVPVPPELFTLSSP